MASIKAALITMAIGIGGVALFAVTAAAVAPPPQWEVMVVNLDEGRLSLDPGWEPVMMTPGWHTLVRRRVR